MIQIQKLTKKFGDVAAVDEASFEVREGEVLGFLGPNAAGKTTTIHMFLGLIKPDFGTIGFNPRRSAAGRMSFIS